MFDITLCKFKAWGFLGGTVVKNPPTNVEEAGLVSGLGRSPGGGNSYPLQYSCLENSMDRGAWQATVHGLTESDMTEQLSLSFIIKYLSS